MARRKRPYVPKVKGCYECSQRRIDCDGTRPSCKKCASRGLSCSGFGTHYKFLSGLRPKAKKQRKINHQHDFQVGPTRCSVAPTEECSANPTKSNRVSKGDKSQPASIPTDRLDRLSGDAISAPLTQLTFIPFESDNVDLVESQYGNESSSSELSSSSLADDRLAESGLCDDSISQFVPFPSSSHQDAISDEIGDILLSLACQEQTFETGLIDLELEVESEDGGNSSSEMNHSGSKVPELSLVPSLACIEPWRGSLLKYFSDYIAPEMVVVDDCHNGWRNMILPIAYTDELVSNSVLSVSAFHLSGRAVAGVADPTSLSVQTIHELQKRSNLHDCDRNTRQSVIMAIVLLLVGAMVNGGSDFPTMFHMLEHALNAIGGEAALERNDVSDFLKRQIHKLRVYAAPFISQAAGVSTILNEAKQSFDCLNYYHRLYPEHTRAFSLIAKLRQQAYNIYLFRVSVDHNSSSLTDLIDHFKVDLESLSVAEGSYGEHVLIWASFIAASESREAGHRDFFRNFLERQYRRNGFGNLLKALELLERIWGRKPHEGWPALLPEPGVFIM